MANYRFLVQNVASGDLYELMPSKASFTETLNKERRGEFSFIWRDIEKRADFYGVTVFEMMGSVLTDIWIERDGVKIFLGAITKLYIDPNFNTDLVLKVVAVDYFGLLAKRVVGVPSNIYIPAADAGAIAWDLINNSQNSNSPYSDWGITEGSIATSVDRERTYRFDKIYEAIRKLCRDEVKNGFDFEITPAKEFNVYYPTKGQALPNLIFDKQNVSDWSWEKPLLLEMTNRVHVHGQGFNDDVPYATRNADNAYKEPFGLLESVLSEIDVTEQATLEAKGDRLLELERESKIDFTLSHYDSVIGWNEYSLGDSPVVDFPHLGMTRATKRVIERKFKWDEDAITIDVKFQ